MSAHDFDKLVEEFAACVMAQDAAIERGDARTGNKHARRYIAAFDSLRADGDPGREALAVLLDHSSASVRVTAAAFLLRYCAFKARKVLKAEAKGTGLPALGAQQTLLNWQNGTWALDPE
jgi:hypothetical protein